MKTKNYNKALILGMGVSGISAARLLLSEGVAVVIIDRSDSAKLREKAEELVALGADVHLRVDELGSISDIDFDICIISPGISADDSWVNVVRQKEIDIISELELGASRLQLPMVAVTGSNGKSTFVKLCGDMLIQNGINAALAGNYGMPLCEVAMEQEKYDWAVVEVSSFQLEHVANFHPDIAVFLNIEPDHLDRHGNMDAYTDLKSRIFNKMLGDNLALVNDKIITDVQNRVKGSPTWKSFGCGKESDYHYHDGVIEYKVPEKVSALDLRGTAFANEITGLTAAAVFAVSEHLSLDIDNMIKALINFESLPHRMEQVGEYNGVLFIDDSKATNIAALIGALKMVSRPVRLIVGGQLKEKDLSKPCERLKKSAKSVYCIGESALIFKKDWENSVNCILCGELDRAVHQAWNDSEPGDVILLAPGCASFDQFSSYKDRGNQFQRIVVGIERNYCFQN